MQAASRSTYLSKKALAAYSVKRQEMKDKKSRKSEAIKEDEDE